MTIEIAAFAEKKRGKALIYLRNLHGRDALPRPDTGLTDCFVRFKSLPTASHRQRQFQYER
ncbi:hypothetical protein BN77_2689 [Rhizobium mesoamericanum STM3625]|uniref:Uncharacterized protein n=1 Tax=Rhizobium mesoamericanum STM3625 TaxID=1211777 RepID=K0PZP6_9HYPH|nr:hypothetical protein BN77_2689 [Rhizobium mesoamericanum STM3625]